MKQVKQTSTHAIKYGEQSACVLHTHRVPGVAAPAHRPLAVVPVELVPSSGVGMGAIEKMTRACAAGLKPQRADSGLAVAAELGPQCCGPSQRAHPLPAFRAERPFQKYTDKAHNAR